MARRHGSVAFTLVELLVVISIIGVLAGLLLPSITQLRAYVNVVCARSSLKNLGTALAEYFKDHGVYPPEVVPGSLDKCSETLYFYLSGMDVDSPDTATRNSYREERSAAKVYFDFSRHDLADNDKDGNYEVVDPWERPWIYVRGMYPGKPGTSSGMGFKGRPFHHKASYDLYSVGPDGRTGVEWVDGPRILEYGPGKGISFYRQAADEFDDGLSPDDIGNF